MRRLQLISLQSAITSPITGSSRATHPPSTSFLAGEVVPPVVMAGQMVEAPPAAVLARAPPAVALPVPQVPLRPASRLRSCHCAPPASAP